MATYQFQLRPKTGMGSDLTFAQNVHGGQSIPQRACTALEHSLALRFYMADPLSDAKPAEILGGNLMEYWLDWERIES